MAEQKQGSIVYWRNLSPDLAIFRLGPQEGSSFPSYKPGQYIALRRQRCRLTRRVRDAAGKLRYLPDLDENGQPKYGPVTHSYSISSAPSETLEGGYLEFYVILERYPEGDLGRLTESLFQGRPDDLTVSYFDRIAGNFTLEERAAGYRSVLLVGTGTGLAPFRAMIKQLYLDALDGRRSDVQYTLLHANRSRTELGYHEDLCAIEASRALDFVYVPSVSRPTAEDFADPSIGKGRANNLLRSILGMPMKEEQDLKDAVARNEPVAACQAALDQAIRPILPAQHPAGNLRERLNPSHTVILTCGNPSLMADIQTIAVTHGFRFEKEDW